MKNTLLLPGFIFALTLMLGLSACNNQSDETPDITEAIPLAESAPGTAEGADPADTPPLPSASQGDSSSGSESTRPRTQPSAQPSTKPSTMQSGSNEDGGRTPDPARTKLVPAD